MKLFNLFKKKRKSKDNNESFRQPSREYRKSYQEYNNNQTMEYFYRLQQKVEEGEISGDPLVIHYVKKQINLLDEANGQFLLNAKREGYKENDPRVGEIIINNLRARKALSMKYGFPFEKYDEEILKVQISVFGEENVRRFFDSE